MLIHSQSHKLLIIPFEFAEDKFAWLRDDEFARQVIAGVNPVNIERMKVFPPESKLDPQIYGPLDSALKEEHILGQLNGLTVQQVIFFFFFFQISPPAFFFFSTLA